jgi:endonuclease/exonuclease/phosphatase family metal-dependent hydrolase
MLARRLILMFLALFCSTCGGTPVTPAAPSECSLQRAPLQIVTYNAGLGPGMVDYAPQRAPYVVQALKGVDWDVLCLQEFWLDKDRDAVIAALGATPDRVLYADTRGLHEDPADRCTMDQLDPLLTCVANWCPAEANDERMAICALDRCEMELMQLYLKGGTNCLNCLTANVGNSADATAASCLGKGASRVFGGRNGVVLLSKFPLRNAETLDLPASNGNHVALLASVQPPGASEPIELACTHLSSPAQLPPLQGGFPDWEAEQRAQLEKIAARLFARAGDRTALLIGDLNAGGARKPDVAAASPSVWDDVVRLGFDDPASNLVPGLCSECGDNLLRGAPGGDGALIDHVLVRDPSGWPRTRWVCSDRILTDRLRLRAYGDAVTTNLSDHYGIEVKFSLR